MTLLSFTSAMKYVLGLMLAMLGFIPYEAIETADENPQKPLMDTIYMEQLPDSNSSIPERNEDVYGIEKISLTLNSDVEVDSFRYVFFRQLNDSVDSFHKMLVIVSPNQNN
ncbi:MAG: hypothetical protein KQI35_13980 [Bacteroidetes bacterium]|nr:hypothetical protein [Bacteroidota bacterium]